MAGRDEIVEHLDALLRPDRFSDFGPNGLQVHGTERVELVATAVSATAATIAAAAGAGADMLLVHHGLIWGSGLTSVGPVEGPRLLGLLAGGISLVGYHLPLDAHETLGNNAILAERIGVAQHEPFATIGRRGDLERALPLGELVATIAAAVAPRPAAPLVLRGRQADVRRIAVVSGGGGRLVAAAAAAGCDLLLTGEPEVDTPDLAVELGVDVVCAGHLATETFGVLALGRELERAFPGLRTTYLEAVGPV